MRDDVLALLEQVGVADGVEWTDLVILQNRSGRSFNVIVLTNGVPSYFVKCRDRGDAVLEWETHVRTCLAEDTRGAVCVPPARTVTSGPSVIQVSPFVPGVALGRVVARQSTKDYLERLRTVLYGIRHLGAYAEAACPFLRIKDPSFDVRPEAVEAIDYLTERAGLDADLAEALRDSLTETGSLPARHQHGDLWHRNVLVKDARLWAIDFEHFGTVRCPLYDDLTLLTSTLDRRPGGSTQGIQRLAGAEPDAAGCRGILLRNALGDRVPPGQLDAVVVYYVTHRAFMVHQRAGPMHSKPRLDDARYVAERLARGERGMLHNSPA